MPLEEFLLEVIIILIRGASVSRIDLFFVFPRVWVFVFGTVRVVHPLPYCLVQMFLVWVVVLGVVDPTICAQRGHSQRSSLGSSRGGASPLAAAGGFRDRWVCRVLRHLYPLFNCLL